jgi:hypothetical protein
MLRTIPLLLLLTLVAGRIHGQCVTTFPSNEPFTSFTTGTPGTLANNWTNLSGDDLEWFVDNNGTPTANTGPIVDRTLSNTTANAKYMYVEASGAASSPNKVAILRSPCYNISSLTAPYLVFWYHMRGSQMGSLRVDINAAGVVTQNHLVISGEQGLYWKQGYLDLSPWSGQANLRIEFRAITGNGELSDIAIDDVFVGNLTPVFGCNEATANNFNSNVNLNNGTCDFSCPVGQKRVRIDIMNDSYQSETSWTLKNGSTGATLASGNATTNRTGTTLCVPANTCLVFRINDTAGDGIYHNSYGFGAYYVWLDGILIKQGGQFGSFEETSFNCAPGFSCSTALPLSLAPLSGTYPQTLATFTTTNVEEWYDFTPPATGAYTISTCGTNSCDTRLWLYDMACGSVVLSDGIEGATFGDDNDGGCGLQANVSANMPGGVLHHLRVGDNAGSCGDAVTVSIIYNGPVVGCMDPQSCNYNPLATIACTDCCIAFGDPDCPDGPDLIMSSSALTSSLSLSTVNITDPCAPQEGCVGAMGQRYVLRFTTRIENIGTTDYYIGSPSSQPQMFNTNNCHGHAHYAGYADYILFDQSGNAIPVGFKNGFCVIDVGCNPGSTGQYGCSNMGISKGCYDIYGSGTTCNWIDITNVPAGTYTLVLRTNWQRAPDALGRHERDYTNNFAQVCINITRNAQNVPSFTVVSQCAPFTDCLGQAYGDARFDCTGVCDGPVKKGDLSGDLVQNPPDAMEYVQSILGNDIVPTDCSDLNADGSIDVTDAALLVNCYTQRDIHNQQTIVDYHPWCEFPRGWLSTEDQVVLKLANLDPINKTVDVLVRNSTCRVLGFEFDLSGLTIQTATILAPNLAGDFVLNTTLGGTKVIGISYIDTTLVKNTDLVPLLRINYLALTGAGICLNDIVAIVNGEANPVMTAVIDGCLSVPNVAAVSPRAMLEGPFESGTQLMRDDLRQQSLIPFTEPYTALGFPAADGGQTVSPAVLELSGPNAVVDWVRVEARSVTAPHAVVGATNGLLQRDGDIVAPDGVSPLAIPVVPGSYHISVRHRNHLGTMTMAPVLLSTITQQVDLTSSTTATWGADARRSAGNMMLLYTGNTNMDGRLSYAGASNDRDPILSIVGGAVPTNVAAGYYREDTNMDGLVKYTGSANDRDVILLNIGGVVPTAVKLEQMPGQ